MKTNQRIRRNEWSHRSVQVLTIFPPAISEQIWFILLSIKCNITVLRVLRLELRLQPFTFTSSTESPHTVGILLLHYQPLLTTTGLTQNFQQFYILYKWQKILNIGSTKKRRILRWRWNFLINFQNISLICKREFLLIVQKIVIKQAGEIIIVMAVRNAAVIICKERGDI